MHKLYTISILLSLISVLAQAQQLQLGVKGGPSLVDVVAVRMPDGFGGEDSYYKMRPSYHFGVFGLLDLSSKFYVQAELLYANKGFRSTDPSASEANIHLHYLSLPVLLNYRISEKVDLGVGGEVGYKLAARSRYDNTSIDVDFIYRRDLDVGLNADLKFDIDPKVALGARYIHGLANVYGRRGVATDPYGNPSGKGPSFQNRVVQISVEYTF